MRLVIDTNVLVSALLNPDRTPARALAAVASRGLTVLVSEHVEREYRAVLARPKFPAVEPARRDALLAALLGACERVAVTETSVMALIDGDDRVFIDAALAGRADAVVTGNAKHYPTDAGFAVLSPAALLARLEGAVLD